MVTGSVRDVGFIYHNDGVENYRLEGFAANEGIEIILPDDLLNPNDEWQQLIDELDGVVNGTTNTDSFISMRPMKFNASIKKFWDGSPGDEVVCDCLDNDDPNKRSPSNTVGLYMGGIMRPRGPEMTFSGYYQHNFGNVLGLKAVYTANKYSYTQLGLGMNLQAGPVNFYLLAQNVLDYARVDNIQYGSVQFGMNVITWKPKK